jgi:hypothetical protein
MMTPVGSNLEGQKRMLLGEIVSEHKDRLAGIEMGSRRQRVNATAQGAQKTHEIACAVMINIVRAEAVACELLEGEVLLVRCWLEPTMPILPRRESTALNPSATARMAWDQDTGFSWPPTRISGDWSRSG